MEDDFRNLTTKVGANLDNPIEEIRFFKGFINSVYVALSGGTLLISVMSQHVQLSNGTVHKVKILLIMKMYLPSSFILRYVYFC